MPIGRYAAGLVVVFLGLQVAVDGGLLALAGGTTTTTVLGTSAEQAGLQRVFGGPAVEPVVAKVGPAAAPTRVTLPSLNVTSTLIGLGIAGDGTIQTPVDYQQAGWYDTGVKPGDPGPAVILGHIDSKVGPGIFYRLGTLKPGDIAQVQRADGTTVSFAVDVVREFSKKAFPTDLVYGPTDGPTLRLITCGGPFDASKGSYEDNVIVFLHEVTVVPVQPSTGLVSLFQALMPSAAPVYVAAPVVPRPASSSSPSKSASPAAKASATATATATAVKATPARTPSASPSSR